MDDSCAVCAEPLEWVAYGACGHREVCSTCVVRIRFVLRDCRCCLCKTDCPTVFVTKALGDYTRVITDFSVFHADASEGQVGQYWFHEDTRAYFDDVDHYRMIRAMCRLSCSVCDKSSEEEGNAGPIKWRNKFRSIEQLNEHLFRLHRLSMCSLCLEGRKVFIYEQKLYTKSQLNQHIKTGDSEVDGSEIERNGFMGHPMCEFCKTPFYGDNELYMHMSTEHYTCHICQRNHPGQYDYYRNYGDLEMHFGQEHFICENEACLEKKFIVFPTEAELKRHNAIEHGGRMSRSKRNAALQIPTSFRYRRSEQEQRRGRGGRGRYFRSDTSSDQLSMAIQASLAISEHGGALHGGAGTLESPDIVSVSETPSAPVTAQSESFRTGPILEQFSFPPLSEVELSHQQTCPATESSLPTASDLEPPEPLSRYAKALSQSSRKAASLSDESFPPLPGNSIRNSTTGQYGLQGSAGKKTLAARLQQRRNVSVKVVSARSRQRENSEPVPSNSSSALQYGPSPEHANLSSRSSQPQEPIQPPRQNGLASPYVNSVWNASNSSSMRHSASAPNLVEGDGVNQAASNPEDVRTANKSLVERILGGLGMDEDRFTMFKSISAEYRQGVINTAEYLSYVEQFGLSHLVLELASLLPDAQRKKELENAYYTNLRLKDLQENGVGATVKSREAGPKKKGKGKVDDHAETSSTKDALTGNFLNTVRKLQSSYKPQEDEVEVLSRDGYRVTKGKVPISAGDQGSSSSSLKTSTLDSSAQGEHLLNNVSNKSVGGEGSSKQRRKASKFLRVRLGDGPAVSALLDPSRADGSTKQREGESTEKPPEGLSLQGVWRKGGVQRLFT